MNNAYQDYMNNAYQDYGQSAGIATALGNSANSKTKEPIRERLQGANKRAQSVLEVVNDLMRAIEPPLSLGGIGPATGERDSTLSTDLDDLVATLANIENGVMRMAKAING